MDQFVVDAPGAVLAVRQSRDDGEPLLLLHGGPGVPDSMRATTAPMLPGFRCISFDQRGVGESACRDGRYELGAYLDDIEAIRARAGVVSWHVLGHSWGGLLAQAYTSVYRRGSGMAAPNNARRDHQAAGTGPRPGPVIAGRRSRPEQRPSSPGNRIRP